MIKRGIKKNSKNKKRDMAKYIIPKRHIFKIDGTATGLGTKIHIDDTEIHGVRDIQYHIGMNEVSTVTLEVIPERCNVSAISDLEISIDINSLYTAISCLKFAMGLDKEFHDAMIASVSSALIGHDVNTDSVTEIAEDVIEQILNGDIVNALYKDH